jgi:nucleotide-binding universal stress UspA family protein
MMEWIVTGNDGSKGAHTALVAAASEAKLHGARLRVVCAWHVPSEVYAGGFAPALGQATFDGYRENAEAVVRDALAELERLAPGLPCEGEVVEGLPAEVLVREAKDASMIVVGNRGRGGFEGLLLGSVSQQVVHHAHCPVLVVR